MSPSTHLWLYQKIIGLYPAPYKQTYGQEMTYYFEDLLHDHGAAHTWVRVASELPSSLWQEYNSLYGDLMNITKREIIVIAVASLSFFIIPPIGGELSGLLGDWLFAHFHILFYGFFGEGNGIMSPLSLITFCLIGSAVALLSTEHKVRNALLVGLSGFVLWFIIQGGLQELFTTYPNDTLGNPHLFTLQYFGTLLILMIGLTALGAYLTKRVTQP